MQLCDVIFQHNFIQHKIIMHPTHMHGNILDLIITNNEEIISNIQISSEGIHFLLDLHDHYPVSFQLSSLFNPKAKHDPILIFHYSKGDYEGLITRAAEPGGL